MTRNFPLPAEFLAGSRGARYVDGAILSDIVRTVFTAHHQFSARRKILFLLAQHQGTAVGQFVVAFDAASRIALIAGQAIRVDCE